MFFQTAAGKLCKNDIHQLRFSSMASSESFSGNKLVFLILITDFIASNRALNRIISSSTFHSMSCI